MNHFTPDELEAVHRLGRNIHHLNCYKDRILEGYLAPYAITSAQCKVLLLMSRDGINTSAELSRRLVLDSGAMSRMLDRLENKHMIIRVRSTADRRQVQLNLTATGHEFCRQLPLIISHTMNDLIGPLSPEEFEAFNRLLAKLVVPACI